MPPYRYGTPNVEMLMGWIDRAPEDDSPFWALNLMRYHEVAQYADGRSATLSGRAADDAYAPLDVLADIGASVALFGDVVAQSGAEPAWHRVGVVRYPSRASFMAMQQRRDFQDRHVHKEAGMERTIVLACLPEAPPGEGPGTVVLRVARSAGGAELAPVAGASRLATFAVEGVILGDGRAWDRVAFDRAPSDAVAAALHGASTGTEEHFALTLDCRIDHLSASMTDSGGAGR